MSEKIPCPITLGEYERIIDNREKDHKCNCSGKCKVCKCKEEKELNLYDKLNETQKEIVRSVCEERDLKLEDCKLEKQINISGIETTNLLIKSDTMVLLLHDLFKVGDEGCQNH